MIIRSGYAKQRRSGSTRAYRRNRELIIATATHCAICGSAFTLNDNVEADHIIPYADGGSDETWNLRAVHKTCNRTRGRA